MEALRRATRRKPTDLAGVVLCGLLAAAPAAAQEAVPGGEAPGAGSGTEITAAASGATLAGSDFGSVGLGAGADLGVRRAIGSALEFGGGVHASWHRTQDLDGPLRLLGAYVEPRLRFRSAGRGPEPFVGLRAGWARWDVSDSGDGVIADVSASGFQAGAVGGVTYPLSGAVSFEAAAVGLALEFGDAVVDATVDGEPVGRPQTSGSTGTLLGVRTSLRFRLP